MERRKFLLSGCKACIALAAGSTLLTVEACSSARGMAITAVNGRIEVPRSALADRSNALIDAKGFPDKLLLQRTENGFTALNMKCPHKGGPVHPDGAFLKCGWHSSSFDLLGKRLDGPAKTDLKTYPVTETPDVYVIDVS